MSVPIELDVGDPPRTIYTDIVDLPDPVQLGLTIRAYNYDDVALYFQVTALCNGWTFGTVDLGSVGSGASIYRNLDQFGSRAKPTSEREEIIKLILKAYTDAGYSDLKWTYERNVDVVFIKSDDPSYTVDVLNDFDDGTAQGWGASGESENTDVYLDAGRTNFVLSAPYSIRLRQYTTVVGTYEARSRLHKQFTTPDKDVIFAIINVRAEVSPVGSAWAYNKYGEIRRDTVILVHVGREYDDVQVHYFPNAKWLRIVVPLPKNATVEVRIIHSLVNYRSAVDLANMFMYMDDFKIISK